MQKKGLAIANTIFLCLNITGLLCFTILVLWIKSGYTNTGLLVLEELLKGRPDANIVRLFLSSHYLFIISALILIAKERLKNKRLTLIVNIVAFTVILFLTPIVFAWAIHLAPIFEMSPAPK